MKITLYKHKFGGLATVGLQTVHKQQPSKLLDRKSAIPRLESGRAVACWLSSYEKGMVMALIARIIGLSLLTGGLGVGLGYALFGREDCVIPCLLLGCTGGIIGAVAGAAREIATARRQRVSS